MLNFTVGPVMASESILNIGAEQVPYFRTPEFSSIMLENERLIKKLAKASKESRVAFITGSGTASMEASVVNLFTKEDKVLVIDGGGFGHRFVELLEIHNIPYTAIVPSFGYGVTEEQLSMYDNLGYTGFLVNIDETSIGVLYDIKIISDFCVRNNLFLVVDSISSFLCDPLDMQEMKVNALITGSQKALACPPGVSLIVLDEEAIKRVYSNNPHCMYLDLKLALDNGERGQTPFTPAVSILLQINARLKEIEANGGVDNEINHIHKLAVYFRQRIAEENLPFKIASHSLSNALTPLSPTSGVSANDVFMHLKDEYDIWICPNGGALKDTLFRVGHIGALDYADFDRLIAAFVDMRKKKII